MGRPISGNRPVDPQRRLFWKVCSFEGCDREVHSQLSEFGLCGEHLGRLAVGLLGVRTHTEEAAVRALEARPLPLKDKPPVGKIKTARVGEPVVYYVRLGPHIKIGHTADLRRRLVAFRNAVAEATVLATEPGAVTTEHRRHRQFAHLRVRNELFEPGPDLLAWIEELAS